MQSFTKRKKGKKNIRRVNVHLYQMRMTNQHGRPPETVRSRMIV